MTAPNLSAGSRFLVGALLSATLAVAGSAAVAQSQSQGATPQPFMELPDLVALFLPPAGTDPGTLIPWDAGTGSVSRIRWTFTGIQESPEYLEREGYPYYRMGHVVITAGGKPVYEGMFRGRQVPGAWRVTMAGPRAGPFKVEITSEIQTGWFDLDAAITLKAADWKVTSHRCSREDSPATFGTVVHEVTAPGKAPVWIQEVWNDGSGSGYSLAIIIWYFADDAGKAECITK